MAGEPRRGPDEGYLISPCVRVKVGKKVWSIWHLARLIKSVEELAGILADFDRQDAEILGDREELCGMFGGVEFRVVCSSLEEDGVADFQDEVLVVEEIKCGLLVIKEDRVITRLWYRENPTSLGG